MIEIAPHRMPQDAMQRIALAIVAVAGPTHAQGILHEYVAAPPIESLGGMVAGIGDVNGDEVEDYVTGYVEHQGTSVIASVLVIDGRKGTALSVHPDKHLRGVIGDVDGDGVRDLVLGPSPIGSSGGFAVHSGLTFSSLFSLGSANFSRAYEVENADGDGIPDLVLDGIFSIRVFAGSDGTQLHSFGYPNAPGVVGRSDAIGDLNGDLVTDFVVPGSWNGQSNMFLLSGADGSQIAKGPGAYPSYPRTIGDVDKDGSEDFAVPGGEVIVRSGSSLAVIANFSDPQWSFSTTASVEPAGDVNEDGVPDLIVADSSYVVGATKLGGVWLFSGRDGSILKFIAGAPTAPLDGDVAGRVDVNGDGGTDIICGRPGHVVGGVQGVGSVVALSFADCPAVAYCTAKINSQGCLPYAHGQGAASLSGPDNFFVVAGNVIPSQFGLLVWSMSPAALPFAGGTLCVGSPLVRTPGQISGGTQPCTGTMEFHFTHQYLLSEGLLAGSSVHCQFWYRDPGFQPPSSIGLTDGVVFAICP